MKRFAGCKPFIMKDFSYITSAHPSFVENMYKDFSKDPQSVDPEFRKFFEGFDFALSSGISSGNGEMHTESAGNVSEKEFAVYRLIQAYRKKGHLVANTNPIRPRKDRQANLELEHFGLSEADFETKFLAGNFIGLPNASLKNILDKLKRVYTGAVGIEYSSLNKMDRIEWLAKAVEEEMPKPLPVEQKKRVLEKLNQGVIFEKFLHTKYIGQKRFSLEGGENTIVALDAIIEVAAEYGVQEVVMGMAHRGRLNVLANILGKTYEHIFSEFEGTAKVDQTMGTGDVKYHLGYGSKITTQGGKEVYLKLCPNPSHLEAVDPVVIGFARAKADIMYNSDYDKILPILIHGDASIAGQGVVYEVIQMSGLPGYNTGGTIHFVINNQIGFTTDFDDARTSDYCTSLAAMIQAPVFHVNGDDAEAVVKCVQIATKYRQEFNEDIFIDLLCYRRHGHNEGDDPKFTQPGLYSLIDKHPNPREVYAGFLLENGEPDAKEMAKEMEKKFWNDLQERLDEVKQNPLPYRYQDPERIWKSFRKATDEDFENSPETAFDEESFKKIFNSITTWPEDFKPLRKVEKIIQEKIKLFRESEKIDWATAELMAFGTLLKEGRDVRMSGQDVRRGTFSSRHSVLRDERNDIPFNRLSEIEGAAGQFRVFNSLLSEYAVLGFEYGYAMANPTALVLWEAQFGDFVNGGQIIIDQFLTSAEQKWNRMNGLVLLLPHGYEGQGPEHSSGRMERFLQQCAELNIIVTNITTASNYFHALRRQVSWPFRKPLINFSPKANLRHPGTYSHLSEFTSGRFKELIDDQYIQDPGGVKKVLLCSGKIYFDLQEKQTADERKDTAIVRLEQLYPLPLKQLEEVYRKYSKATWFWVQEEPLNMGAASYLKMNLSSINFGIISRQASASPATGYQKIHKQEQAEIIEAAFGI